MKPTGNVPLGRLPFATALLTLFILITVVWVVSAGLYINLIPTPEATLRRFLELITSGYRGNSLLTHLGSSLSVVVLAVLSALLVSVPSAIIAAKSKYFYGLVVPPTFFVRSLPPLGYYTILLLIFGIGDLSKFALLFLTCFPPIVLTLMPAIREIPKNLIEVSSMCGVGPRGNLRYVTLPALVPAIISGTRISFGFALSTIVAAEIVAASEGIGWMILDASRFLQTETVFVAIGLIGVIALLIDFLLSKLEPLLRKDTRQ